MSLLPKHKSKFDKRLDEFFGEQLAGLDLGVINTLADSCPAGLLPILAASFDVNIQNLGEVAARGLIKKSFEIHHKNGTAWAVREVVKAYDAGALIIEGNLSQKYNAKLKHDGVRRYGSNTHWAEFSILASKPLSIETAKQLKAKALSVAAVRCVLASIDSTHGGATYDGNIKYDNKFNHGEYR
ncbi:phage tail protein [Campylobacter sp. RM12920]|uniref:Phage tail protein n=1 Tax=Campylobacter californiensis TaxID=1032243 RepID=A0ABD4JIR4_9BACT|nr:phage tail protein [Campylobacter sp. RM12919]MBE2988876.1 phage tail protein [Campylobacter sp. RM12920]